VAVVLEILWALTARTPLSIIFSLLVAVWCLGLLVPYWGVFFRRLHDTAKSGWWVLLCLAPFGGLVLIFFLAQPTYVGLNKYATDMPTAAVFS
jgi:uncharacterized membrane protein YhaH (DUF805 family)